MRMKRDRYEVVIPEKFRKIALGFKRAVAVEIRKADLKRYTVVLVTNNPRVNFQDEICYLLNQINLGKRPPKREVILEVRKPSGWKKLKGYYAKNRVEFKSMLRNFRRGLKHERTYQKRFR